MLSLDRAVGRPNRSLQADGVDPVWWTPAQSRKRVERVPHVHTLSTRHPLVRLPL